MSVTKDLKFCESSFPAMLSNVFMLEPILHLLHLLLGYKLSFFITCRFTWFTHQVETSLHVPRHLCTQGSRGSLHALFDSSPIILPQAELVLSPCHSGKKLPCHVGRGPKTASVILRWISFGISQPWMCPCKRFLPILHILHVLMHQRRRLLLLALPLFN